MLKYLDEKKLKTITQEELDEMVDKHEKWIESNEKQDNRGLLYLYGYNLSSLKIKNKNLIDITFYECLLDNVVFENCNLKGSEIKYSKIINTNFMNCNFSNGYFYKCNFINSDLLACNIKNTDFDDSIFNNTIMPDYPMTCPKQGSFIAYKKVRDINNYHKKYILKLEIPEDARRSSAMGIRCRCDKVKILEIQDLDGSIAKSVNKVRSIYSDEFVYELSKTVEEPNFDKCRWHECAPGIHFFMNREDAVNY